jgi:hypothetical protein
VCPELTAGEDRSTPSKSAFKRRKSAFLQSRAVEGPRVTGILPRHDLTLLTEAPKRGGIAHKIHPFFVPEIIARCEMRCWNAQIKAEVTNVLHEVVVKNDPGNFCQSYDMLREAQTNNELAVLRILLTSHQHTAKDHHYCTAEVIAKLLGDTTDPAVNYFKANVFWYPKWCVPPRRYASDHGGDQGCTHFRS